MTSIESLRLQSVQLPIIPAVNELIRQSPGTISLGQGVVWYSPPPQAIESINAFLSQPRNHQYQPTAGLPELHDIIKTKLQTENGIETNAGNEIVVTAGSNMGFVNALLAIADPGDEIIVQSPYYFNHEMAITMANCKPIAVPTDENYQLRLDAIEAVITNKTRAIVTISPNNPTGAVYSESGLRQVNQLCRERGIYHISDEAYEYFTWDGAKHFSSASISGSADYTISLFSLSKAYGFASWRIGFMVIPQHLFTAVKKVQDTLLICPPVISQYAALGALQAGAEYCRDKLTTLAEVRATAAQQLQTIHDLCTVPMVNGAFYFLMKINSSLAPLHLVERLVNEHKVAAIPGSAFGLTDGCYLRVSYGALQKETAIEGIGRLVHGLKAILKG
jgi:aspartate/methionine/tyrosine aminotransferase